MHIGLLCAGLNRCADVASLVRKHWRNHDYCRLKHLGVSIGTVLFDFKGHMPFLPQLRYFRRKYLPTFHYQENSKSPSRILPTLRFLELKILLVCLLRQI